jgi:hypothetical protein
MLILAAIAYVFRRPQKVVILRDNTYFYPARFPIPRPFLRPHEVPHFLKHR